MDRRVIWGWRRTFSILTMTLSYNLKPNPIVKKNYSIVICICNHAMPTSTSVKSEAWASLNVEKSIPTQGHATKGKGEKMIGAAFCVRLRPKESERKKH